MTSIEPISTEHAPAAIGPYSQAVECGGWILCSGQIPLDPKTGELVEGDITVQTRQVLENLTAVLAAAGGSLADVARCTVYLKDMNDFPAVNEVYASFFGDPAPARSTVEVARLPKDALVEIDAMGKIGHSRHTS